MNREQLFPSKSSVLFSFVNDGLPRAVRPVSVSSAILPVSIHVWSVAPETFAKRERLCNSDEIVVAYQASLSTVIVVFFFLFFILRTSEEKVGFRRTSTTRLCPCNNVFFNKKNKNGSVRTQTGPADRLARTYKTYTTDSHRIGGRVFGKRSPRGTACV